MTQHKRDTYVDGREVIQRAIDYLKRIRDVLDQERERDHPERVKLLLNSVEVEQRNLLGSIERFLEDAPDKVLHTYAQYILELPMDVEPPEQPLTTLGLVQWLQRVNNRLYEEFAELSQKYDSDEQMTAFRGIADQVQAHERRLSKEYQRFEDL